MFLVIHFSSFAGTTRHQECAGDSVRLKELPRNVSGDLDGSAALAGLQLGHCNVGHQSQKNIFGTRKAEV